MKERDELFGRAGRLAIEANRASAPLFQRFLGIGYTRAAILLEQLEAAGVIGPFKGTVGRDILVTMDQFENYYE